MVQMQLIQLVPNGLNYFALWGKGKDYFMGYHTQASILVVTLYIRQHPEVSPPCARMKGLLTITRE